MLKLRSLSKFATFTSILMVSLAGLAVPAEGHKIMISAANPHAIEVGRNIAEKGGNVVDVAVAVGLTLSVTNPYFAGLGGGGFALVKMGDGVEVIDFREMAPQATSPKYYIHKKKDASRIGGTAVGVPGWPAGLQALHKKHGKLDWSRLFFKPIQLAQKGFRVSGEWVKRTNKMAEKFNDGGKIHFFKNKKLAYKPGEKLRQRGLTKALKEIRNRKTVPFYTGMIARDIVTSVQRAGGVLTLDDMKNYKVRWLKPMTAEYEGNKFYLMPPPSSGGVVIKSALYIANKLKLSGVTPFSVDEFHLLGETLNRSFRGRALLGDPDFHKNPLEKLLGKAYLDEMAESISLKEVKKLEPLEKIETKESAETTHFSVVDNKGNAVSLTVTLNGSYGSGVVSKNYGIAMNNEMDDFTTRPGEPNMFGLVQGAGNYVEPGKRPLSSMSPTIIVGKDKSVIAIGAPGGPRIISGVFQAAYRLLVTGLNVDRAIQSPRVHNQFLPHKLFIDDQHRFMPETIAGLKDKGHEVEQSWNSRVYAVRLRPDGLLESSCDSRGECSSGGL